MLLDMDDIKSTAEVIWEPKERNIGDFQEKIFPLSGQSVMVQWFHQATRTELLTFTINFYSWNEIVRRVQEQNSNIVASCFHRCIDELGGNTIFLAFTLKSQL